MPLLKVPEHNPTIRRNVVVVTTLINSSEKNGKILIFDLNSMSPVLNLTGE